MGDPVDDLKAWLSDTGTRQVKFARLTKTSIATVWRWLHRENKPSGEAAAAIERITGIPAASWWDEPAEAEDDSDPATTDAEPPGAGGTDPSTDATPTEAA